MDELFRQVALVLRGMWLHRRLAVGVAWIVGVVAGVVVFAIPDKYEASARIYVDTDSVLKPLMSGMIVQANTEQQVGILSRTLISRPNVEKLLRMADLDLGITSDRERDNLIEYVTKTFKIRGVGKENLYTLEYRDADPEKAKRVVQSMTTIFVESSLGNKRSDTDSARRFLEEQIDVYRKKLEEAENRLKEFKLQNIDLDLSGQRGADVRMAELASQLSQARLELREAESARDAMKRELVGEEPVLLPDSQAEDFAVPELDGRIDAMKLKLDSLLQQYTEEHPDIRGVRRIIADLEAQKRQKLEAKRKAAPKNSPAQFGRSPAFQALRESLANSEAQVASLRTRVAEYESRYSNAKNQVKMVPQIESEYAQLNRDYGIIKKNYDELVQRRESASITEGMSAVSGVADFRLIDPPRTSNKPVAPNRLLLLPLALVISIGCGLAGSFLASQLRPTFSDAKSLSEAVGLPLLGVVSRQLTPTYKAKQRKSLIRVGAATGALLVIYAFSILAVFFLQTPSA